MPDISPQLRHRVEADFPQHTDTVLDRLQSLDPLVTQSGQNPERMFAAVVRLAQGRLDRLDHVVQLARSDWRDLLVGAGFGDENWPEQMSAWLAR